MVYGRRYIILEQYAVDVKISRRTPDGDTWDIHFPAPDSQGSQCVLQGLNLPECGVVAATAFQHMEAQVPGFCASLGLTLHNDLKSIVEGTNQV